RSVLGNHDYWTDAPRVAASLESAGIPLLTNKHVLLRRDGDVLCIAGVNDVWSTNPPPDAAAALAGVPQDVPRIVLCHNPDYAEVAPRDVRIDLMLSGHTHGGQVRLPFVGPLILPIQHRKYAEGLVQGPTCPVFISRGLGMVGVPMRLNCKPELPLITLRKA
ncbi:MAG: metallophosphoesterase, partial [Kiritimatiellae bacterium]|nr:metallophosphoesterase [Kiritimatiellia bacterium]